MRRALALSLAAACSPEPPARAPAPAVPRVAAEAQPVDCSAWPGAVAVPGGPFLMGSDTGDRDERPQHVVTVSGFCLDRLERAAGEVSAWLAANGKTPARDDSRTLGRPDRAELAATELSYEEAAGFCASLGGRLPTEAEWEKAARGGCEFGADPDACDPGDARTFPWGDAPPTCATAPHLSQGPPLGPCTDGPAAPGSHPNGASPYGALDMAGNAWEWISDWYHPSIYGGTRDDPGGPAGGRARVLRGGAWNTLGLNLRVTNRMTSLMEGSASGVRCAFGGASPTLETPPPLRWASIEGSVRRADGADLAGRALVVTAFAEEDLVGSLPRPGASPASELRLHPTGHALAFSIEVPDGRYLLMAALDDRPPDPPEAPWSPPASSGGVGGAGPVPAGARGVEIALSAPPGAAP